MHVEGEVCIDGCVVLGAVAPTPRVAPRAAELLIGERADKLDAGGTTLVEVGRAAMDECEPIDDLRGSAAFRRHLVRTLTERAVVGAIERAAEWRAGSSPRERRRT